MTGKTWAAEIRHQMNRFLGAVVFLTRIPVGDLYIFRAEELPRSAVYFPVVGSLIGFLAGAVLFCIQPVLPAIVAVLLCMLTTVLVTGALHEDGLADAVDGCAGGSLLLLDSLVEKGTKVAFCALIVANGLGRAGTVALLFTCPYVREGESKASAFANSITLGEFVVSLLPPVFLALFFLGLDGLACVCGAAAAVWAAAVFFRRMIGGITGDCLGATNQLIELLCYLLLAGRFPPIIRILEKQN